jgi:hypothetical protein
MTVTARAHTPGVTSDGLCKPGDRSGIVGVIGRCSSSGCTRRAARHVELRTARAGTIRGAVCERCARATASAAFLLELIA